MKTFAITNSRIIQKDGILEGKHLIVRNGIISAISGSLPRANDMPVIDGGGHYLAPGLVELHIHGGGEHGFDAAPKKPHTIAAMAACLAEHGVNTFLPTTQSDPEVIEALAVEIENSPWLQNRVPGIYVEGPFVNAGKRGGILSCYIQSPDRDALDRLVVLSRGSIVMMTFALELDGSHEIIRGFAEHGIIPCLGHSDWGLGRIPSDLKGWNITHLFNAMSGISHKTPGLAMLPFLNRDVFFELNADGIHVCKEAVDMCYRHLNREKMILISDAVVSAGLPYGEYEYFDRRVVSGKDGVRYKDDGTLIGSNKFVDDVMRSFRAVSGASVAETVRMVTANPCELLGISERKGSIEVGKEADLILLDDELRVKRNLGELCHPEEKNALFSS